MTMTIILSDGTIKIKKANICCRKQRKRCRRRERERERGGGGVGGEYNTCHHPYPRNIVMKYVGGSKSDEDNSTACC